MLEWIKNKWFRPERILYYEDEIMSFGCVIAASSNGSIYYLSGVTHKGVPDGKWRTAHHGEYVGDHKNRRLNEIGIPIEWEGFRKTPKGDDGLLDPP